MPYEDAVDEVKMVIPRPKIAFQFGSSPRTAPPKSEAWPQGKPPGGRLPRSQEGPGVVKR